mgnify:CR=1 FL=1
MKVELREQDFDCWKELAAYEKTLNPASFGACSNFVGSMRDFNLGDTVSEMFLEHYPGMTDVQLKAIAKEALQRWPLEGIMLIHRVGAIKPADNIVITAAWSAHREDAFPACRFLIEELKKSATFWKKETTSNKSRWVSESSSS